MNVKKLFLAASIAAVSSLVSLGAQAADTYKIDPVHSTLNFKVKHFFNYVTGSFPGFEGTIEFDAENPANNKAKASIQVASVQTHNANRDAHLQRNDFFDAAQFPQITYESSKWTKSGENTYTVEGTLTMHGVSKSVTLEVELLGSGEGVGPKQGLTVIGLDAKGKINRAEWGVKGAAPLVSDEVLIDLSIQAQK